MYSLLICGSRIATPQMLELARRVVQRASELGWTILVGDAAGIDAEVICACESLKLPAKCFGISPNPARPSSTRSSSNTFKSKFPTRDVPTCNATKSWSDRQIACMQFGMALQVGQFTPTNTLSPNGNPHTL